MQKFKLIIMTLLVQNFNCNQATLEDTQYTVPSGNYKAYHGFGLSECRNFKGEERRGAEGRGAEGSTKQNNNHHKEISEIRVQSKA